MFLDLYSFKYHTKEGVGMSNVLHDTLTSEKGKYIFSYEHNLDLYSFKYHKKGVGISELI